MTRTRAVFVTALALTTAAIPLVATAPATAAPAAALPWDFNGDGHADLVVGAPGKDIVTGSTKRVDAGAISVFMAAANGTYGPGTTWRQGAGGVPGAPEKGDQFGYAMTSGDYDGDGYADLAVSANREAVGSGTARKADAGMVIVLWGSASGLTGGKALAFNPSAVSAGSYVGDSLASGDMDGDGRAELAVGSPGTEAVGVYRGADKADFGTGGATRRFTEATANVPGTKHVGSATKAGDLFGETLAMGDFDHDGFADLAVGAPYDYDTKGYAVGAVTVFPGTDAGSLVDLRAGQVTRWSPYTAGVQGTGHTFTVKDLPDSFGRTLAAGDFDGDGADDLAIGIPGTPVKRGTTTYQDAGRIQILFGRAGQGITSRDRLLSQDSTGMAGASHKGDLFGASLAATTRPAGHDVLAVGSAKEYVWALPEGKAAGSKLITQNSTGVWGNKEKGDGFGSFVRFLDRLGDPNKQALAVSAPGEDSGRGVVHILPAGSGGLPTGAGSQRRLETDTGAARQAGDAWGWLGDSH